jgi:hypothetical protein
MCGWENAIFVFQLHDDTFERMIAAIDTNS